MDKRPTLNGNKLMGILIDMLETEWQNEIVMTQAIKDFQELFGGMNYTEQEYKRFIEITDSLYGLKQTGWEKFMDEMKSQQAKLN